MTAEGLGHDLQRLSARLDDLTATVARLATDVEDLGQSLLPLEPARRADFDVTPTAMSVEAGGAPASAYDAIEEWVADYFLQTFRRHTGGELRWCHRWQEHPEAVLRLEALWRSWESMRDADELGLITWLTHYLDPQLHALMHRGGTFASCSSERHAT